MIRTDGLTKRFGSLVAVDRVDLDVREGDIYGFLGANGSGKTTTVRMLLGLVLATSGSITVLDEAMPKGGHRVLPQLGALVEGPGFYGHLSGRANLATFDASGPSGAGRRDRARRISEVMEQVGLAEVGKRPVRAYSLGMRQRLGLGAALLRRPRLLVLDEPTNGLDPQGIREIRELLLQLHRDGTTIFLSSHLLAEVEQLCSRVGVLDRGRLVVQEELSVLRRPTGHTVIRTKDIQQTLALLDGRVLERRGDRLIVAASDTSELNAHLVRHGVRVEELRPEERSLEEVVLELTDPERVRPQDVRPPAVDRLTLNPPALNSMAVDPPAVNPPADDPAEEPR
ncbi:ABC-2 type transport system ATP-binding protein [Frankineae bacterium MT45]|nr:ABC-2 type transport system ATP-binding protein [Frankineae bacterium MT45]